MMMVGWILMVLLVIGAVAVLILGAGSGRTFSARGDPNTDERSALRTLEDRFASGEIDRKEFERRRAILTRR